MTLTTTAANICAMNNMNKLEESLNKIAQTILGMDEASLSALWEKYKTRAQNFTPSITWEKDFIIFSIINSVRVKNNVFNDHILKRNTPEQKAHAPTRRAKPDLKLVK